jgi:hypothetical protein
MTKDPRQQELSEQEDHGDVSDHYRREVPEWDNYDLPCNYVPVELGMRCVTHDTWRDMCEARRREDSIREAMREGRAVTRYEWREQERHLSKSQLASAAIAVLILGTAICFAILLSFGGK